MVAIWILSEITQVVLHSDRHMVRAQTMLGKEKKNNNSPFQSELNSNPDVWL